MKLKSHHAILAVGIIAAIGYIVAQQTSSAIISPQETHQRFSDTTTVILDVRTPQEHNNERIVESLLIPVQELESRIQELDSVKDKTIIAYCRSGNRSGVATEILRKNGFNAFNMSGGINRWKSERLPTLSGVNR